MNAEGLIECGVCSGLLAPVWSAELVLRGSFKTRNNPHEKRYIYVTISGSQNVLTNSTLHTGA